MICEISIIVKPEEENNDAAVRRYAMRELAKKNIKASADELTLVPVKKSIDARHGQVKFCLRFKAYIGEKPGDTVSDELPKWKPATEDAKKVIVIGSGPAGLFGALKLLESGIKPVIIERGEDVHTRKRDIAAISTKGIVDENSNYCFGEGGAGTFSDGKLYTRSNKRGNISRILQIFVHFGADKAILTAAHPHIGTDRLPQIIEAMRNKIIALGGEFHFGTKFTGFILDEKKQSVLGITAVKAAECAGNAGDSAGAASVSENAASTADGNLNFYGDAVLLATGHSATDVYFAVAHAAPEALEAKTFATGVRVEHPRQLIDAIQYHGKPRGDVLPTAEYRLTTQVEGRGVYSFCMCPGGFVVPSATGPDEIVINGMSPANRGTQWSNAAIVVETRPEDIPETFTKKAEEAGCKALSGLFYRTSLEAQTKKYGKGQKAPAQRLSDFLDGKESQSLPKSSYTPGLVTSRIDRWLPNFIKSRLIQGFKNFNKNMKGFICPDAIIIASETRTSTPVRILRNKETFECTALKNLYPAGEGSGYSGGIVSSAMDGENACEQIAKKLLSH